MQYTQHALKQHTRYIPETAKNVTVKGLTVGARELLKEHGCILTNAGNNATMVSYPQGTTRQELLPDSPHTMPGINYIVSFPSGFELQEVQTQGIRYRKLYLPKH
jgi:hypothetical protein